MNTLVKKMSMSPGMDIVIITTGSPTHTAFWQTRMAGLPAIIVTEDWSGGAGNGLGSLYAIKRASEITNRNLVDELHHGKSIAIYHTAGAGKRQYPLAGTEHGNKSAIRLPGLIDINGTEHIITVLEAVIKQTSIYAPMRKGRLSVFWGDQIFIPIAIPQEAEHHIDILGRMRPVPDSASWQACYGALAINGSGEAVLTEKADYRTFRALQDEKILSCDGGFAVSLGSFSISATMTELLMNAFSQELHAQQGSLNSDRDFWMTLTLPEDAYALLLGNDYNEKHYETMQAIKRQLSGPLFGVVDIGNDGYWWDYGTVSSYYCNNLKLVADGEEADTMRAFFNVRRDEKNRSVIIDSNIGIEMMKDSVAVRVNSKECRSNRSLLIEVNAPSIAAENAVAYRIATESPLTLPVNAVHSGKLHSDLTRDGKKDWDIVIPGNPCSYAEIKEC